MAQCYQCGSDVEVTDRFCMECGALDPGRGRPMSAAEQAGAPNNMPPFKATAPTWLPPDTARPGGRPPTAPTSPQEVAGSPRLQLGADDSMNCPRCGASLPKDARFCGDCGEQLGAPASPSGRAASVSATVLPDPIPPPESRAGSHPISGPAQPVLPPFRASNWTSQPTPAVEIPDNTWTSLPNRWQAQTPEVASPWGQDAPAAARPAAAGWAPAQPQPPGGPGLFGPTALPASPYVGAAASPAAAFPDAIRSPLRRNKHPRSQVIILIMALIVTIVSGAAGLIVQFVLR